MFRVTRLSGRVNGLRWFLDSHCSRDTVNRVLFWTAVVQIYVGALSRSSPLIFVSLIWGCTNPFIKRGTKGVKNVAKTQNIFMQFLSEVVFLLTNWQYVVPFLVNQIGSIVYFFALQSSESQLSLAVPITNSLTFVVTALAGSMLGEDPLTKSSVFGIILIIIGTTLCFSDKT